MVIGISPLSSPSLMIAMTSSRALVASMSMVWLIARASSSAWWLSLGIVLSFYDLAFVDWYFDEEFFGAVDRGFGYNLCFEESRWWHDEER